MSAKEKLRLLRTVLFIVAMAGVMLSWTTPVKAHVTSIVIDSTAPAYGGAAIVGRPLIRFAEGSRWEFA